TRNAAGEVHRSGARHASARAAKRLAAAAAQMAGMGGRADRGIRAGEGGVQGPQGERLRDSALADRAAPGESCDPSPRTSIGIFACDGACAAAVGPDGVLQGAGSRADRGKLGQAAHLIAQRSERLFVTLGAELAGLLAA